MKNKNDKLQALEEYHIKILGEYKKLVNKLMSLLKEKATEYHYRVTEAQTLWKYYYYVIDFYLIRIKYLENPTAIYLDIYDFVNKIIYSNVIYENNMDVYMIKKGKRDELVKELITVIENNDASLIKSISKKCIPIKVDDSKLLEVLDELDNDEIKIKLGAYLI